MMLHIPGVLTPEQVARMRERMKERETGAVDFDDVLPMTPIAYPVAGR